MSQWIINKVQGGHHVIKRDEGHLPVVADVYGTDEEARLIAAAPETARQRDELLAVLEDIMRFQVKNDWMDLPIWVRAKEAGGA
tara:strand:- start:642 stop:893 length:252 start_codon:yes stop_codon:yes gene_type:complete